MLVVKVPLKKAEQVRLQLLKQDIWDKRYVITRDDTSIYFPVKRRFRTPYSLLQKRQLTQHHTEKPTDLKEALREQLTPAERAKLKTAFDIVGSIAILEIDRLLQKKEKIIAKTLLDIHPSIKTVVKKAGGHEGEYRLQKYIILAGKRTKETTHKENGIVLKLNIEKTYFSPRLAHERMRIAEMVMPGEKVLVMFSGIAPYPCVIAKHSPATDIYAIEKNPGAHTYALKNIKINKFPHIRLFRGDARRVVSRLKTTFDRIIMPLPKGAEQYLDVALRVAHTGSVIHYYDFILDGEEDHLVQQLDTIFKALGVKYTVINILRCGQSKPHEFRVCVDILIKALPQR